MTSFVTRYLPDSEHWFATCWFLPQLSGTGRTEAEAVDGLKDLIGLWAEERIRSLGDDVRVAEATGGLYA